MAALPPGFQVRTTPTSSGATPPPGFQVRSAPVEQTPREKAAAYLDQHPEAGPGVLSSLANKAGQGFTFGWGDEIASGLLALKDTVKHGGSLKDNYELEHAMQEEMLDRAGKKTGAAGVAAEVVGGLGGGLGLAKNGVTLLKTGQGLLPTIGRGIAEGAAYGGVTGAGTAEEGDRIGSGLKGAAMGGAIGGALPVAVRAVGDIANRSGLGAKLNPAGYAEDQLGKTISRSGKSAEQLTDEMANASNAGQGNYVLADALGENGQSQLAAAVKLPGAARQAAVDELSRRNTGMGRQVGGFVDDAFNTHGNTAKEYEDLMTAARKKAGDVRYDASRANAGPVDLNNTMSVLQDLRDPAGVLPEASVSGAESAAPDAVEKAAKLLARPGLGETGAANYNLALDAKRQIGDLIEKAARAGGGYEAEQAGKVSKALDAALSQASPGYRRANDTFSRMSRPIEAIEQGQKAATSGRAQDTINTFSEMRRPAQQGFRVGYADKLNRDLGGPTAGAKINEMLAGDVADEISALAAPGRGDLFREQLQRSQDMVRTGNRALGGSPTAELIAGGEDLKAPISALSELAQGNVLGAAKNAIGSVLGASIGDQEAVRNQLIPMLMSRSGGIDLPSLIASIQRRSAGRQMMADDIGRGVMTSIMPAAFSEMDRSPPAPVNVTPENIDALQRRIPR